MLKVEDLSNPDVVAKIESIAQRIAKDVMEGRGEGGQEERSEDCSSRISLGFVSLALELRTFCPSLRS
jgi:hypothetical protein